MAKMVATDDEHDMRSEVRRKSIQGSHFGAEGISILIVDDDKDMCETLSDIFEAEGYRVVTTGKGTEALALVKKGPFVICLVDIKLPDIDGVKVLQGIKDLSADSYVIMITAFATLQNSIEALNKGAYAYILKPFEMDELKAVMKRAVENYELVQTKRKLERELKGSEERYRELVEGIADGIYTLDLKGNFTFLNKAFEEMAGYSKGELIGRHFKDLLAPEYIDGALENFRKRLKGKEAPAYEQFEIVNKKGERIPVWVKVNAIKKGEKIVGVEGIVRDITEWKKLHQELRESEEKYRSLLENANDAICFMDLEGYYTFYNPRFLEMFEYTKEEMEGKAFFDIVHPEDLPLVKKRREERLEGKPVPRRYEYRAITKNGDTIYVETNATLVKRDGRVVGIQTILRDVTVRKRLEQELKESKDFLNNIIESSADSIITTDLNEKILSFNRGAEELFGYKVEEVIGTSVLNLYPEELREKRVEWRKRLVGGEEIMRNIRTKHYNAKGELLDVNLSLSLMKDGEGRPIGIVGIAKDITKVIQMEEALKESEEKYSTLVEEGNDGIVIIQDGLLKFANPKMVEITGFPKEEAIQRPFTDFVSPEYRELVIDRYKKRMSGEEVPNKYEIEIFSKDGRKIPVEISASIIQYEGRPADMAIVRDITERKRAKEALRNALEESQQRRAEISALLEGSRTVLECRKFEDAARFIFDSCKNLIGVTAGYVALLSKDGTQNEVLFLDSGGLPCTVDPSLPMPIRGLREEAYRTGKAVYHNDFSKSEWAKLMPEGHVSLDNVLFAPLVIEGKAVGLLGIANKPGGFTKSDARMASAFGELAAIALLNSRMLESLKNTEERFRSVAQTASDAIISVDSRGNIVFWNDVAETMFGYSADEAVGKPLTSIMPERFREAHQNGIKRVVSTGKSNLIGKTIEMVGLRKDGTEFPLELSLATWETREGIFFTGIIRDITERKKIELKLKDSHRELEEKVKELESINKLMIGRELKMIELKKEIKDLKRELKKVKG